MRSLKVHIEEREEEIYFSTTDNPTLEVIVNNANYDCRVIYLNIDISVSIQSHNGGEEL